MVHAGPGTVIRLPGLFSGLGASRVLLVSDQGLTDLESLNVFLRKRRRPSRPRQGQQLSLLGPSPDLTKLL